MAAGPNAALVGEPDARARLATPCLLLETDAFQHNLAAMMELVRGSGRQLRPHVKAHKCSAIARRQLDAGAVGLCCATVREAEVMAEAGIAGILVTSPVTAPAMVERLAHAHERVGDLAVVVDSEAGLEALAAGISAGRPLGVLVEIDVGQGRTGVTRPEDAVRLARLTLDRPQLRYRGVQAYYGHLQHVPDYADRKAKAAEQWARLQPFLDALSAEGLAPEIVTGGGTGTYHLDLADGPFTEIQPGSYLFMDRQYGAVELAPGGTAPLRTSLTVASRVISANQPDLVVLDAGYKAMATDAGPALVASGAAPDAAYQFMGDEHGGLRFGAQAARPQVGDLVTLVAPHCDPTVNLHDWFHVMQDGRLVDIWPIDARGY
ncbi:MAG TPA: DSD1 family PLP-dependent enzyme [Geminicoccaceae bacterium]|nr:DSD1 family PLP-dependent enzyme [Geminicoccaceae bacterium]